METSMAIKEKKEKKKPKCNFTKEKQKYIQIHLNLLDSQSMAISICFAYNLNISCFNRDSHSQPKIEHFRCSRIEEFFLCMTYHQNMRTDNNAVDLIRWMIWHLCLIFTSCKFHNFHHFLTEKQNKPLFRFEKNDNFSSYFLQFFTLINEFSIVCFVVYAHKSLQRRSTGSSEFLVT